MEEKDNLTRRVERLESLVEKLSVQLESVVTTVAEPPAPPKSAKTPPPPPPVIEKPVAEHRPISRTASSTPPAPSSSASSGPSFTFPDHMKKSEYWLNKIGIALLLFGAVFLFKYSVDQGWLNPLVRVIFGLALGTTLSVIGLKLYAKKKHFCQVLLGGSIATFYITGYSAFQLFHLVPYAAAFGFFVAVTLYSFYLALKQNEFIFSLVAIAGGLGTPFLLYTGQSSTPGLMLYTCVLLAGASGVYFFKGWWSFFWTTCIGGITVIQLAIFSKESMTYSPVLDKVSIEIALFLTLPFFWFVPLLREIVAQKSPTLVNAKPKEPETPGFYRPNHSEINVNLLTVIIPLLALGLSTVVWSWNDSVWGTICLSMALLFGAGGWYLNAKSEIKSFAFTHTVIGLTLLTVSLMFYFEGDVLFGAVALLAIAIHLVRFKVGGRSLTPLAHILFGLVSLTLFTRLIDSRHGLVFLNAQALADLLIPAGAFGLSKKIFQRMDEKRVYLAGGFLALAGITFRELSGNIEFFVIAAEILAFLYVAVRMNDNGIMTAANLFGSVVGLWLLFRLFESSAGAPIFNENSLVDFAVMAMIAAGGYLVKDLKARQAYLIVVHIALLLWFWRELSPLENGQGIVSIAWGIYTVAMFVVGLRRNLTFLTKTAMVTLIVLIGKLFLVDLKDIETIWRVLIFLGFGTVLLFLSYYFRSLWKTNKS